MHDGSTGHEDRSATVNDLALLLSRAGLDRSHPGDLKRLSYQTSLSEADVRSLLDGAELDVPEVGHREVARRIQFLIETRLCTEEDPCGTVRTRQYTVPEIAAGIGVTPQWLNTLLTQRKQSSPNLKHSTALARFFGVPLNFLTDEPAEALLRVLRSEAGQQLDAHLSLRPRTVSNRYALQVQRRLGDVELDASMERALMLFVDGLAREGSTRSRPRGDGPRDAQAPHGAEF
ncbi:hypothetical protein AB0O42_32680 [Streptomyces sp. NPDC089922]|uniref:hypothetical protein n=1 Tax=Streptomyces sp. NPDC089922 TaxID=3155189 RepID=UPI0034252642